MKGLEHIILNKVNDREVMFECKHCNLNLNVELPMNIVTLVACKDTFIKIHRNCKQRKIKEQMTIEFINQVLEEEGKDPTLLTDCVLQINSGRSIIYNIYGETDYKVRTLEICYADDHSDELFKGEVFNEQEVKEIIIKNMNR